MKREYANCPVWIGKSHHAAVKAMAPFSGASMQKIIERALDLYAASLTGKQREVYDRAFAGEKFERWELKYLGRAAKRT